MTAPYFLPPNLWGLHPLYLADVPLFAAHLSRHLSSSPDLPRDSHFLYGSHPLRSVEVSGVVTLLQRRGGGKQLVAVLDDGTGAACQLSLFLRDDDAPLPFSRGAALLARGALGWSFKCGGGASSEMVREVRLAPGGVRLLRGGGGGLGELAAWWTRTARLHRTLFRQPLEALMPSCTPLPAALRRADGDGGGSGSGGGGGGGGALLAPASLAAGAGADAAAPPPPASSQEDAMFPRLVFALQAAIASHHPLSLDSAGAVSALQAATHERARRLHAQVAALAAAGARAAVAAEEEDGEEEEEEEGEGEEAEEWGGEDAEGEGGGVGAAEEGWAADEAAAGAPAGAPAAAVVDVLMIDTEPETEEEEDGRGAPGRAVVFAPRAAVCIDDGAARNDAAIAAALAEGRWVVGNLSAEGGGAGAAVTAAAAAAAAAAPAAALAAPPSAPAAPPVPHLPELFSGSQASALLARADPAQAAALRGYAELRWGAAGAVDAVARYVGEALERLVLDGVLYKVAAPAGAVGSFGSEGGSGSSGSSIFGSGSAFGAPIAAARGGLLYGVVTHVHLIAPATLRVLQRHGSRWDGMEVLPAGGGGGAAAGGPLPTAELLKALLAEDARLKSVPLAVLRASWELMQSDGSILFPTQHTVALA